MMEIFRPEPLPLFSRGVMRVSVVLSMLFVLFCDYAALSLRLGHVWKT
jgi:hypothetical protein